MVCDTYVVNGSVGTMALAQWQARRLVSTANVCNCTLSSGLHPEMAQSPPVRLYMPVIYTIRSQSSPVFYWK